MFEVSIEVLHKLRLRSTPRIVQCDGVCSLSVLESSWVDKHAWQWYLKHVLWNIFKNQCDPKNSKDLYTCYSMYCQGQEKVWRCGGLTCSKPVLLKPQRKILSAPALMLLMHLLSSPEACGKACWDVSGRFSQQRTPPSFQAVRSISIYSPRLVQRLCKVIHVQLWIENPIGKEGVLTSGRDSPSSVLYSIYCILRSNIFKKLCGIIFMVFFHNFP